MACGCGGTNGGSGGCGGDKPLANPLLETELAHELPQATASAVVEFDPAPAAPGADAVNNAVAELGVPVGIRGSFSGTAGAFQSALAGQPW